MACLAAALFCGVAFLWRRSRVRGLGTWQAAALTALAVALGLVFARLFYFGARSGLLVPMHGWGAVADLRPQGLALSGAVIGGAEWPEVAEIGRAAAAPFEDVVDLGVDGETVAAVT